MGRLRASLRNRQHALEAGTWQFHVKLQILNYLDTA